MTRSNSLLARSSGRIDEMSGARMPAGAAAASGAAASGPRLTRWPMRNATTAITAIPGTIHGNTVFAPGAAACATGAPQ
jgi:hypothetical protein